MEKKNRLTSKVAWIAVLSQVLLIVGMFVTPEISDDIKIACTAIIEILTVFGVLNNPTDGDNF